MLTFIKRFWRPLVLIGAGIIELIWAIWMGLKDLSGWTADKLKMLYAQMLASLEPEEKEQNTDDANTTAA